MNGTVDTNESIYDMVANLQTQVAALTTTVNTLQGTVTTMGTNITTNASNITDLQSDVNDMQVKTLSSGADIHQLAVGRYIVPTVAIAATLLNAPDGVANSTAYVDVVATGGYGQKTVYYHVCNKNSNEYFSCDYYSNAWGDWKRCDVYDSGWIDLPLYGDVQAYGNSKPQYRRVGNLVSLRGAVQNVLGSGVLGTLPVGCRPTYSYSYVQNTSLVNNKAKTTRLLVGNNGELKIESIEDGASYGADKWFPIHCEFTIN